MCPSLYLIGGNVQWYGPSRKSVPISLKIKHATLYDPVIALLGREMKTYVHKQTSTGMSMATLFIITKTGNNPGVLQ